MREQGVLIESRYAGTGDHPHDRSRGIQPSNTHKHTHTQMREDTQTENTVKTLRVGAVTAALQFWEK